MNQFEKVFVLDTNIILNNAKNLDALSQGGKNLIVLPETVIDEIDSKKSGFDEINFQAREFARLLYDARIKSQLRLEELHIVETVVGDMTIYIVSKDEYAADHDKINSIKNDRKILEVAAALKRLGVPQLKFISLDVMARTRALSLGIDTEPLNLGKKDVDADMEFHNHIEMSTHSGLTSDIPEQEAHISSLEIDDMTTGRKYFYYKSNTGFDWLPLPDKNENKLPVPPINARQKVMAELILQENDIVVVTGPAGTGKTLSALSAAMRLIDTKKAVYKKIYYIRRTVISGSNEDELGFLPGSLEEKMAGYVQPMEDSIRKVAQLKKKDQSKEELEARIEQIKEAYDINYLYSGHLRGSTLDDGSILICDETQNWDIASIRTIFSRIGKNSIIIAMGSNNQIDSRYLTKNTNALTFLMNKCGQKNDSNVKVKGVKLINVMRSKIAEWADIHLY